MGSRDRLTELEASIGQELEVEAEEGCLVHDSGRLGAVGGLAEQIRRCSFRQLILWKYLEQVVQTDGFD